MKGRQMRCWPRPPPFEVESDDVSVIGQPAVWKTLVLEEPLFVPAGERVMAAMEHFGGDSVQLGLGADQAPQTVFVSYQGGSWQWTYDCPHGAPEFGPEHRLSGVLGYSSLQL